MSYLESVSYAQIHRICSHPYAIARSIESDPLYDWLEELVPHTPLSSDVVTSRVRSFTEFPTPDIQKNTRIIDCRRGALIARALGVKAIIGQIGVSLRKPPVSPHSTENAHYANLALTLDAEAGWHAAIVVDSTIGEDMVTQFQSSCLDWGIRFTYGVPDSSFQPLRNFHKAIEIGLITIR